MKAIKKSKKILKTYLSRKLSQDEFEEAMKHPVLSTRQKLEITDAYFESIGSRDITIDRLVSISFIRRRYSFVLKRRRLLLNLEPLEAFNNSSYYQCL